MTDVMSLAQFTSTLSNPRDPQAHLGWDRRQRLTPAIFEMPG
jgi:hypothetical protein